MGTRDYLAMKLTSYWLDTAKAFEGGKDGPIEEHADIAVIGGGFTGLSAALALARRGAKTVVVEAGRVGGEASGRNGGHCNNALASDFRTVAEQLGCRSPARAITPTTPLSTRSSASSATKRSTAT
jgi:2-polyprenyl-6-methoxyphenol hydroxylase-like FAD-dependent oxidoreductase